MNQPRAFTLIELLVVIGIIGILATLILSAVSSATKKGQQVHCVSNLQQIGRAMRMYVDGTGTWPTHPVRFEEYAHKFASRYFHGTNQVKSIWTCPAWKDGNGNDVLATYLLNLYGSQGVDSFNFPAEQQTLGIATIKNGIRGKREQEIAAPSEMIVMGEMVERKVLAAPSSSLWQDMPFNRPYGYSPLYRHNKKANILFGDGHVESPGRVALVGKDESVRSRWNSDHQPHNENWR